MKSYDYVLQENNFDCGLASLMTCYKNMGIHISKEEITKHLKVSKQGIKAYDLVRTSKELGINSYGIKGNFLELKKTNLPCIAHIIKDKNYYHYIVILKIDKTKKTIKVFDPASGPNEISFEDFEKITTQIYIVFDQKKVPKIKDKRFKKYLKLLFLENKKIIFCSLFMSLIFIILSIINNYYIKILLELLNSKNINYCILTFILFLFIVILKNLIEFYRNNQIIKLGIKINRKINKKLLRHIIFLPYEYYSKKEPGELVNIINDAENFKDIIVKIFVVASVDIILIIFIMLYMAIYNIMYLFIILLLIIIIFIITTKYKNIYNDNFIKMRQSKIIFSSKLLEIFNAFYTIKGLHIENKLNEEINKYYNLYLTNEKKYLKKNNLYNFNINNICDLFYLIIIIVAVLLTIYKDMYFLNIVLFSSMFYLLIGFINNIADSLVMYKTYKSSIEKVLDILDIEKETFKNTKLYNINKINFNNVNLIIEDKKVLDNINFEINKQDKIFVKGKSGTGKSSIIKLLLKYYKPTSGKILLDNINYENIDLKFIRENITYVSQNEYLFTDTIYNNLNIVCESKTKIKKAINTCLLNETFTRNNIDENYLLVEDAINISGGERKKILIARALLKARNILILDETFNEIDIDTERKILKNIFNNYKNLTVVLISHRYNNSDLFNKIITT